MNARGRILVVAAVVAAVVLVLTFKRGPAGSPRPVFGPDPSADGRRELAEGQSGGTTDARPTGGPANAATTQAGLPRLIDLGATQCIPCKMMAPILEELKVTYAGKLRVDFVDVWENRAAASEYGIQLIPTQIFQDASGKELFRHEGYFSKEDILAKWAELGIDLSASAQ